MNKFEHVRGRGRTRVGRGGSCAVRSGGQAQGVFVPCTGKSSGGWGWTGPGSPCIVCFNAS